MMICPPGARSVAAAARTAPGSHEVLEDLRQDDPVVPLAADRRGQVVVVEVQHGDGAQTALARQLGRLGIDLDPVHRAAPVDQDLTEEAGGAADVQDSLAGTDEVDDERVPGVRGLRIDRLEVVDTHGEALHPIAGVPPGPEVRHDRSRWSDATGTAGACAPAPPWHHVRRADHPGRDPSRRSPHRHRPVRRAPGGGPARRVRAPRRRRRGPGLDVDARGGAVPDLPPSVTQVGRRVPARLVRSLWRRGSWPPVELLVGTTDVFHGTNFVSPPTRHAREVVTVHDLTYERARATVSDASLLYRGSCPAPWPAGRTC